MAAPIARSPHTTERCIGVHELDSDVVDEEGSRTSLVFHPHQVLVTPGICAEVVDGERLVKLADKFNRLSDILVSEDWQDRPKDFFFHDSSFEGGIQNDGGQQVFVLASVSIALNNCASVLSNQLAAPLLVEVIDALAQSGLFSAFLVDGLHVGFQLCQELLGQVVVHQDVIAADAELATVQEGYSGDLACCVVQVAALVHDQRALATKFKNAGHEVFGGGCGDQSALLSAACENYKVKRRAGCSNGNVHSAIDALEA
mmetsp:Transcript_1469/g.2011  ORF Transcript_1469/g.2011 Transcript_1469/m.2011 type:complete len:258 (+) Transcript_1469:379-1152(+)